MNRDQPIVYVLLSGGLDSSTALARAHRMHDTIIRAVSIDYGQRHRTEIGYAQRIAGHYMAEHVTLPISMPRTMLTDDTVEVPAISYAEIKGVSPTYTPFRNGLMLSTLTSYIAGRHLDPLIPDIDPEKGRDVLVYWGAHADDAAGDAYPDCSVEFIGAMACAVKIGTYGKVRLVAPFATMGKHEIVRMGHDLNVPFEMTFSCYRGGAVHCGECATCRARKSAFEMAGVYDPTEYAT